MLYNRFNLINFKNKFFIFCLLYFSFLFGYLFDFLFWSILFNQIILLYFILFFYSYNIWSITSQFHLFNLFYQIFPGFISPEFYLLHGVIIFIIQITSAISIQRTPLHSPIIIASPIKKISSYEIRIAVLFTIIILSYLSGFKYGLYVQFASCSLLTYLIVTNKKNFYVDAIFLIILFFLIYKIGFLGGDRRFLIFFIVSLGLFIIHRYKLKFPNIFYLSLIPIGMTLFFFQGLYRVFGLTEGISRFSLLKYTTLTSFFENIDIGVFNRIFHALFNEGLYSHIQDHYITGMSFERVFYLWLPRELWADKPFNLSTVAGDFAYPGNSAPISLPMEIYVNFGIWLCPIFFLVIAKLFSYLDRRYYFSNSYYIAYYFFLVSFFIVIYRGSIETDLVIFSMFFIAICLIYEFITWVMTYFKKA